MKDFINYTDKQAECLRQINKEEAKIGDYAKVDGFSGFCQCSYNKITDILTRYDETTGKPYKVVCCGDNWYHFDSGWCVRGASAYKIFGYYRF
mgnify:CR=1 FL=1